MTCATSADTMRGGAGYDFVDYFGRTANLVIGLDGFADDGELGENDLAYLDIERVRGGDGNDRIGDGVKDSVSGGAGTDSGDVDELDEVSGVETTA